MIMPYPAIFKVKEVEIRFKSVEIRTPTGEVKGYALILILVCIWLKLWMIPRKRYWRSLITTLLTFTRNCKNRIRPLSQESLNMIRFSINITSYWWNTLTNHPMILLANYVNAARGNKKILNHTSLRTSLSAILRNLKNWTLSTAISGQ